MKEKIIAGKYQLKRLLGRGAHAEVYEAQIIKASKKVAVKIFYRDLHQEILKHILKELKVISSLSHPNILKIIAFGQAKVEGELLHYLVTPLIEGNSLAELLKKRKKLSVPLSIKIALQVGYALQYMHENNFIHRDVKPQNILIDKKFHVVLSDFGIVCSANTPQTTIAGTIEYCAPEQLEKTLKKANPTLDIYSLGMTLYEMLTGVNPYREIAKKKGEAAAIKFKYVSEYPLVTYYNKNIPKGLALVIKKMITNNSKERYKTIKEVISHLQPYETDESKTPLEFTTISGKYPQKVKPLFKKALEYRKKKEWKKAIELYEKIISIYPNSAQVFNYYGEALLNLHYYTKALKSLELSLNLDKNYYSAYCHRAHVYINLNRYKEALKDINKAISLNPDRPEAYFYKALLHKNKARYYLDKNNEELFQNEIKKMKETLQKYDSLKKKKE